MSDAATAEAGKGRTAAQLARDDAEQAGEPPESPGTTRASELARRAREAREAGNEDVLVEDDAALAAREAAASGQGTESDWDDVTEWLLGDQVEQVTRKLKIRVGGTDAEPRIIPWIVKAVPTDVIRQAEREASGNRSQRRGRAAAQYDDLKANLRVVVEGTHKPDLKAIAKQADLADATVLVQRRFAMRPGVIARLAGEIMSLSGFDDEDVVAAGNA